MTILILHTHTSLALMFLMSLIVRIGPSAASRHKVAISAPENPEKLITIHEYL